MNWRVNCSSLKDDNARHPGFEIVSADTKFVSGAGVLSFFRVLPEGEAEVIELCGVECKSGKPCVRRKGHPMNKRWGHMDKLAPKQGQKPKLLGVRDFNASCWTDCVLVED